MYVITFVCLQYAVISITEYICADGHRIKERTETINYDQLKHNCPQGAIYQIQAQTALETI